MEATTNAEVKISTVGDIELQKFWERADAATEKTIADAIARLGTELAGVIGKLVNRTPSSAGLTKTKVRSRIR